MLLVCSGTSGRSSMNPSLLTFMLENVYLSCLQPVPFRAGVQHRSSAQCLFGDSAIRRISAWSVRWSPFEYGRTTRHRSAPRATLRILRPHWTTGGKEQALCSWYW